MPSSTDIANYVRCARRSYLDVHGDPEKRLPPSAFLQMLWEGGRTHEEDVIGRWAAVAVPSGALVGEPDLLVRVEGYVSRYGVYAYIPVDVKNGNAFIDAANSKPKPAYAVQLCVYAELLMTAQGMLPPVGRIIDKDGVEHTYDLAAFYPSTLKALAQWMGFRWRDEDPGGAQSLAWWNDYWTNPKENAHLRERVLRYNEDDVRASFVLKDWLAAFCAPAE